MAGAPAAGEEITEGYEQLRRRVQAAGPDAWRFGRGLVAGRGVAAWVGAWAAHDIPAAGAAGRTAHPVSPAPREGGETGTTGCAPLPADGGGDLVAVLAQMALAHARTTTPTTEGDPR